MGKNIVKAPARQLFRLNDLVFKYIRTTLQTYKVDERTFQTPCIICKGETSFINLWRFFCKMSLNLIFASLNLIFSCYVLGCTWLSVESKKHKYFKPMIKSSHKNHIEFQILFMFRVYFCPLLTTPAPTVFYKGWNRLLHSLERTVARRNEEGSSRFWRCCSCHSRQREFLVAVWNDPS